MTGVFISRFGSQFGFCRNCARGFDGGGYGGRSGWYLQGALVKSIVLLCRE